jgi:hypothetical protein
VDFADLVFAVMMRSPLLHFMLLGALLFAARWATDDGRALGFGREMIVVTAADVERLRRGWTAETGHAPSAAELQAAIRRDADEEMLVREARRLGLDRIDPIVRARLVQNLRFVHAGQGGGDDEHALLAEADALGMSSRDAVARRRLVQAMEQRLGTPARIGAVEVRDYVTRHPGRYEMPARIAFRHVFFSADRRGAQLERVALAARPGSGAGGENTDVPVSDPFLLGAAFPPLSQAEIARAFGAGFARAVMQVPERTWSGPLRSTYGLHYVFIEAKVEGALADAVTVERQAYYALLEEREQQTARAAVMALRRHYPLQVEWPAVTLASVP